MPPYRNYIYEYHAKITSGEIIAGKWIKKIYEIIINGLQKQEYFFNAKAANKAIRFIENFCHHSKGRNDLIKLELWQKAIVSVIFGIQDAEKIRIFREIFIVIGRKNGKSLFASAIIAYMAYLEPEYGQEIYCLAPKLDQAALVYDGFYQMVQAEDELAELAKKRRSDIYIAESNTVIKPIAFNAKKSDGFNPQLVVWVNEGAGSDKQKKNIAKDGMITFAYHKLRCAVAVSLEVDTMAISAFETLLINNIVEAMTKALEQAIIDGNGTGKPKGILAETPANRQTIESAAPSYSDLIKAEGALPMAYENGAVWCMSKKTFMEYVGMTDKNGQPIAKVNYGTSGKPERRNF